MEKRLTWPDVAMELVRSLPAILIAVAAFFQADRATDKAMEAKAEAAKVVRYYAPKGE